MSNDPTSNGRDGKGRFTPGNPGGPGNPHAARTARLRSALLDAVTPEDVQTVARRMVEEAKAGNVQAGRELLDRVLGKAHQTRTVTRQDERTPAQLLEEARRLAGVELRPHERGAGE